MIATNAIDSMRAPLVCAARPRRSLTARALARGYYLGLFPALAFTGLTGHIAQLGGHPRPWLPMATIGALSWLSYLLDRLFAGPEDALDSHHNAAAFARQHRRLFVILAAVALTMLALLGAVELRALAVGGAGLALASAYFVELPGLGLRLKDIPYAKGAYAALLPLACSYAAVGTSPGAIGWGWTLLAWLSLWLGHVIYDLKDVEDDRRAGVRTLATALDRAPFLLVVGGVSLAALLGCQVLGRPAFGLASSFAALGFAAVYLTQAPFDRRVCGAIDAALAASFLLTLVVL